VPLELTIVHADVRELTRNLGNRDAAKQAGIFAGLVRRLDAAGARAAAITSIAGHFCARELEALSPLPIIDAIPEIDAAIKRKNLKTVGLLGTRAAMESGLYGAITAAEVVLPDGETLDRVHASYVEMATVGRPTDAQRHVFFSVGRDLCRKHGADGVVLAGTDLFLAFQGQDCGFPVLDCADVHINAIYRRSAEST